MVAQSLSKQLWLPRFKKKKISRLDFFPQIEGKVNRSDNNWEVPVVGGGSWPGLFERKKQGSEVWTEIYLGGAGRSLDVWESKTSFPKLFLTGNHLLTFQEHSHGGWGWRWCFSWGTNLGRQLVKLIWPPENWIAVMQWNGLYQLYCNQNIRRMVSIVLSLSFLSEAQSCRNMY